MKKEEKKLRDTFGTANHFLTPDGYFDQFQANLMANLPAREESVSAKEENAPVHISLWTRVRPWVAAAAVVCAGAFIIRGIHTNGNSTADGIYATTISDDDMTDFMATSFFDEYTLYCYLTGEN